MLKRHLILLVLAKIPYYVFHQFYKKLWMFFDRILLLKPNCIQGNTLHENLEGRWLVEDYLVVSDITLAKTEKVIDKFWIALTILLRCKDLLCGSTDILEYFFKQGAKFWVSTVLC